MFYNFYIELKAAFVLAIVAMLLQITVFLQPLLPERFQISLVCVTISELKAQIEKKELHHAHMSQHNQAVDTVDLKTKNMQQHHHTDHQCLFCTVYGHLSTHLELNVNAVLDRIQIRLIAFQKAFKHVYFILQRLFLTPQGRAPPLFA